MVNKLEERIEELERLCAEAYQVVGLLADEAGRFGNGDPHVEKILDNLSEARIIHEDVLPFPSKQAVPDGWRLVPEEPTPEWETALGEAGVRIGAIEHVIQDVLATAPQPAAQPTVKDFLTAQPSGNAGELPDERAAFDHWFRCYQYLPDDADTTQYDEAFLAFKAWQARAAQHGRVRDDDLRFIARVLESNAPQQDREKAAQMLRNMRRQQIE